MASNVIPKTWCLLKTPKGTREGKGTKDNGQGNVNKSVHFFERRPMMIGVGNRIEESQKCKLVFFRYQDW